MQWRGRNRSLVIVRLTGASFVNAGFVGTPVMRSTEQYFDYITVIELYGIDGRNHDRVGNEGIIG